MRRREFLGLAALTSLTQPRPGIAQATMANVGIMIGLPSDPEHHARLRAFQDSLSALGWKADRNIRFTVASQDFTTTTVEEQARTLVAQKPDVLVANGTYALALMRATASIPVVFTNLIDPVGSGIVRAFVPGGKVTGFGNYDLTMGGKWLSLLLEAAPDLKRVVVLKDPDSIPHRQMSDRLNQIVVGLGVELIEWNNRDLSAARLNAELSVEHTGMVVLPSVYVFTQRAKVVELAKNSRAPAIFAADYLVRDGGLMAYGIDEIYQFRQVADYVDRILRGASPGDLPIQMADRYKLSLNQSTARILGRNFSNELLNRADEVIE